MKTLVLISKGKNTCLALQKQLQHLLGEKVNIKSSYIDGSFDKKIKGDLVLFSGRHAYLHAHGFVEPGCPVILARRSINHHELDQLFDLPAGTNALLVNDLPTSTRETIDLLKALGIDHINYTPYSPGIKRFPPLKLAITPGESDLVPPCAERIIDIKTRTIDITTLVEVLDKLSLLDEKANLLSALYLQDIITLIKRSKQNTAISTKMKNQLQTILNTVHDGIIATDQQQHITVFNPVAEKLWALDAGQMIGRSFSSLPLATIAEPFDGKNTEKESFIKINHHHVVMNAAAILDNGRQKGIVYTFKDVSEIQRLEEELRRKLVSQLHIARYTLDQIQGISTPVKNAVALARKMAGANAPILIQGESGTGKELFAQGIHNASPRKKAPFIAFNFAALPENLLESELFGYEEGSFTGARKGGSAGLFEQAHKGTIFLDEVGDAPLSFQVKILRVLQEKQVRRIGSSRLIPVDVRVIAATNTGLKDLVQKNLFRRDLYYRLNVLPLKLPPLKHRQEDILLLAQDFYNTYCTHPGKLPAETYFRLLAPCLLAYDWPGNIRELQNIVEYLSHISPDQPPTPDLLPEELTAGNYTVNIQYDQNQSISDRILTEIARCNQQNRPVGRRSLAAGLALPESVVRKAIQELEQTGRISVRKGRKGLVQNK